MQLFLSTLLEILITLSQDGNTEISEQCKATLNHIHSFKLSQHVEIMEQLFHLHIIKLPRIICSGSEEEQTASFLLLKGLLLNLSKAHKLKTLFTCSNTLEQMISILLSALELDRSMDLLKEEHSLRSVHTSMINKIAWKSFSNLRNDHLIEIIRHCCQILGISDADDLIIDHLLDLFSMDVSSCNEIVVLLQMMLFGQNGDEFRNSKIEMCLESFLAEKHWTLAIQANQSTNLEMVEVDLSLFIFMNNFLNIFYIFSMVILVGMKTTPKVCMNLQFLFDTLT